MPSNFDFLQHTRPELHDLAVEAEALVYVSPRAACMHARFCLEHALHWLYEHDATLPRVREATLAALIYDRVFVDLARPVHKSIALVHKIGNLAAHHATKIPGKDAQQVIAALFSFFHWLARYYGDQSEALPKQVFRPELLPRPDTAKRAVELSEAELAKLRAQLSSKEAELAAQREGLGEQLERAKKHERELAAALERLAASQANLAAGEALLDENVIALDAAQRAAQARAAELAQREAELEAARRHAAALRSQLDAQRSRYATTRAARVAGDALEFDEATTREQLIDVLLREAGWPVDDPACIEVELTFVKGGQGRADYVFWAADGRPIAVIEAKKASVDLAKGKNQALLYADALEREHGQRPVMFYTNGLEIALWDDARGYPPRTIAGFYTPDEVERLIARRTGEQPLDAITIDTAIAGRDYQTRAIRAVTETFDRERRRRALLAMATGTGKTRIAVALVELLSRAGWAKRVLVLTDRVTLADQARKAFRKHAPHVRVLVLGEDEDDGRAEVLVSTYPSMLNALERPREGLRAYSPGAFDLVIVDEAHRSVYQRFGMMLEYFDARMLGLTATPRHEVARDTYRLFHLDNGEPTFAYELAEAVADGWLVPPRGKSAPFRFLTEGVVYEDLDADEREEFELKLTEDDGSLPHRIDPNALNRWLYNIDTIDQALAFVMEHAIKVEGGDRLGKTIIFARNVAHARLIVQRFDANYPNRGGKRVKVVVSEDPYAKDLVDDFVEPESPDKAFDIAISVDMLDTGVDVPDLLNLVFFKPVFSPVKYQQMIGRGTRLCPDLFGPGQPKTEFLVIDLCGVLDFYGQLDAMAQRETPLVASRSTQLFQKRLELTRRLAARRSRSPGETALLGSLRDDLHARVAGMTHENFFVRPQWPQVQRFVARERWDRLDPADIQTLRDEIAPLPTTVEDGHADARAFDLRCVQLQLTLLEPSKAKAVPAMVDSLIDLLGALAQRRAIPQVAAKLEFIESMRDEHAWLQPSVEQVERVRVELRDLMQFVDHRRGVTIYTDFEDTLLRSAVEDRDVPVFPVTGDAYRRRVTQFIREHRDHLAIAKLRTNKPLTPTDLAALEELLLRADVGESRERLASLYGELGSLGRFIRSLVGLERTAALEAFSSFLNAPGRTLTAAQSNFVRQIIDYLTARGVMDVAALYEPPFTDAAAGPESLFEDAELVSLLEIIDEVNANARTVEP